MRRHLSYDSVVREKQPFGATLREAQLTLCENENFTISVQGYRHGMIVRPPGNCGVPLGIKALVLGIWRHTTCVLYS
jgi:hypothetical protein